MATQNLTFLTREQILGADDYRYQTVAVPEWGGTVLVRSMTGAERDAFEDDSITTKGKNTVANLRNIRARLVSKVVVSDFLSNGGKALFTRTDIEALGQKNAAAISRIFDVAMELSGLTEADVKELADDFGEGQNTDSGSN